MHVPALGLLPPSRTTLKKWVATSLLALAAVLWISPLLLLVLTSVRSKDDFNAHGPLSWPQTFSWESFASAWEVGQFADSFRNSALITLVKVPIGVVLAALLAYALAKLKIRFRRAILFGVLLGLTVPIFIAVVPLFGMLRSVGLTDSLWSLLPPYLAFGLPFEVFVLESFFRKVPDELIEAARIDGAGNFRIFAQLVLPLSLPALTTVFILDAVSTWNELVMALILLSSPDKRTIPLGLLNFQGQFSTDFTGLSAGVLIGIVPVLIGYTLLQRWIVSGLTAGAVKG
jgi:raffinose/stachyose/melibiose transport system permease protein